MQVGQKVLTELGTGVFIGWECYDRAENGWDEINWRVEEDTTNVLTTNRKAVKIDNPPLWLAEGVAYFFEHEKMEII